MTHRCPGLPPHTFNGQNCEPCNRGTKQIPMTLRNYLVAITEYVYALWKGQL